MPENELAMNNTDSRYSEGQEHLRRNDMTAGETNRPTV